MKHHAAFIGTVSLCVLFADLAGAGINDFPTPSLSPPKSENFVLLDSSLLPNAGVTNAPASLSQSNATQNYSMQIMNPSHGTNYCLQVVKPAEGTNYVIKIIH